jgi:hypothetical protein
MRRLIAAACLVLAACSRTPSSPSSSPSPAPVSPAAADYSGLWTGTYRFKTCSGERHCVLYIGTTRDFSLRVQQSGSRAHALLTLGGLAVDVDGVVGADGALTLSGFAPAAAVIDTAVGANLSLRMGPGRTLTGSIDYRTEPPARYLDVAGALVATTDIATVVHQDLAAFASAVDGTWSGRLLVRSCTPPAGGRNCYPTGTDEPATFDLTLARSGDTVSGTFASGPDRVPVAGRISGTSLSLEGETLTPASGGPSRTRVTGWQAALDGLGRMTGTLQYEYAFPFSAPVLGETAAVELLQVIKRP